MLECGRARTLAQASGPGAQALDPWPPAMTLPSKYASAGRQTRSGTKAQRGEWGGSLEVTQHHLDHFDGMPGVLGVGFGLYSGLEMPK